MAKILLIVIVFALVYFIIRGYARTIGRAARAPEVKGDEDMVQCLHCGVHLPRSESLQAGDTWFCSEEHRRLHGS